MQYPQGIWDNILYFCCRERWERKHVRLLNLAWDEMMEHAVRVRARKDARKKAWEALITSTRDDVHKKE